jgi:hypothetical protein
MVTSPLAAAKERKRRVFRNGYIRKKEMKKEIKKERRGPGAIP